MNDLAPQNPNITYAAGELYLEVKVENETVWLTQTQIVELFNSSKSNVSEHIKHIFQTKELDEISTVRNFRTVQNEGKRLVTRDVTYYNLDMIISIGYRINSIRGTQFRIWANSVLKDYLLKGYSINKRFERIEDKLYEYDKQIAELVQTALPPKQGIYFDGQIFDAYLFANNLIKGAKSSIILIDNYIDESVLLLLSKRNKNVLAHLFTKKIPKTLKLDLEKHNYQYSKINIQKFENAHDRFLIIDEKKLYHIGASLKDLGKKWFGFSCIEDDKILKEVLSRITSSFSPTNS